MKGLINWKGLAAVQLMGKGLCKLIGFGLAV